MLRSDADSGRSSCSAGSGGAEGARHPAPRPIIAPPPRRPHTREASTNTDTSQPSPPILQVSSHPRIAPPTLKATPQTSHIFPQKINLTSSHGDLHRPSLEVHVSRRGGLTNAFSSIDLVSSTQIEQLNPMARGYYNVRRPMASRLKVRRQPVQRAASRLYRSGGVAGKMDDVCVGPEFIVRAGHPSKALDITNLGQGDRKTVVVILLNGQKIDVACDPNTATAGEVFQAIIQSERFEHNFMLGISALVGGDFIFLPDEYRIRKVAPENWLGSNSVKKKNPKKPLTAEDDANLSLFLRIKFFMPANLSKAVKGGAWRGWVYLQLRRSVVEGQITLQLPQLVELAGFALQAEFGNYSHREHFSGDYYLMEHYLPEGSYSEDDAEVRVQVKQAHESHKNMTSDEAKESFIALVQTFKDYGSHFYTAVWATRDGYARDVWLSISPRGMILYSRNTCISALPRDTYAGNTNSRVLLQSLAWQHIHTLYYNKRTLYVVPNDKAGSGNTKTGLKLKLKMESNKSYFTFWLASLHHRFYMRLHADINSLLNISDEFSIPLQKFNHKEVTQNIKPVEKNEVVANPSGLQNPEAWLDECSNYHDSYNLAVRGHFKLARRKSKDNEMHDGRLEEFQNKENEKPNKNSCQPGEKETCWCPNPSSMDAANASSSEVLSSPESCSLPRRLGVKMGTRAYHGSNASTSFHHKQFHSLDATQLGLSPTFSDQMNRLNFSPERLVQSDIELASTLSDSDDLSSSRKLRTCKVDRMNILPPRNYNIEASRSSTNVNSAYVIESPQANNNTFAYQPHNDETMINCSLQDRLNTLGCVQSERCFRTVTLVRDGNGALGMQVAEGSDGNVYVKSITPGGSASRLKQIFPGDQIISLNGQTLLNLSYNTALLMLQNAPKQVEIILLQSVSAEEGIKKMGNTSHGLYRDMYKKQSFSSDLNSSNIVAKLLNGSTFSKLSLYNSSKSTQDPENNDQSSDSHNKSRLDNRSAKSTSQLFDNDLLNVEALKTINVLLALTKRNIERKTSLKNIHENDGQEATNSNALDKHMDYNDMYQYSSSTESTPSKKHVKSKHHSFSMNQESRNLKRRPLSVHIPADVDLFEALDSNDSLDNSFSFRTRSCDNITVLKANNSGLSNANSTGQLKLTPIKSVLTASDERAQSGAQKGFGFGRKWVGRVKYPVTPSKIGSGNPGKRSEEAPDTPPHFAYGKSLSDDEQIFI